jgi:hypothetical protein
MVLVYLALITQFTSKRSDPKGFFGDNPNIAQPQYRTTALGIPTQSDLALGAAHRMNACSSGTSNNSGVRRSTQVALLHTKFNGSLCWIIVD